jgi:hypothetical protein
MDERKPRSRRLLVTTKTLENAIAAPASIGLSRPAAASGRAAVAEHGHVAGAELHQGAEGRTRLALGAVLEPAPGEDEAGDARGCLAPWRRLVQAARWNGQAPHTTTGAARVSEAHCQ